MLAALLSSFHQQFLIDTEQSLLQGVLQGASQTLDRKGHAETQQGLRHPDLKDRAYQREVSDTAD
jgi:hypothetical protein